MKAFSSNGVLTVAIVVGVAGCGAGRGGNAQQVVAAARAPLLAAEHRNVRAFCGAYTPQVQRQLVLDRRPRISGDCEDAMRALIANPQLARVYERVAAGVRVIDVVIQGNRATAHIGLASATASTMAFSKTSDGRWLIASLGFSAHLANIR